MPASRPDAQDAIAHARYGDRGGNWGSYVQTNFVQEVRKKDKASWIGLSTFRRIKRAPLTPAEILCQS